MNIKTMISGAPLLTYEELEKNKLYIIHHNGWAKGLLFCPKKDWKKLDVISGIVFEKDEITFIDWEDCLETRFELAPPETTVIITQGE